MNLTTALRLFALSMILAPGRAFAQQAADPAGPPYYGYGPWHMMWGGYGGGWWMFAMMLIFFLAFAAIMVVIARSAMGHGGHFHDHRGAMWERYSGDATDSALQILNERFARGEIQREEYQDRKAVLLGERQG